MSEVSFCLIVTTVSIAISTILVFLPIKQSVREGVEIWPWKRLFARGFDVSIYVVIYFFLVSILNSIGLELFDVSSVGLFYLLATVLGVILECILLMFFGTTPGKWLLKIELNKTEIPFDLALSRTLRITVRQIPLISLFFYWRVFRVLKKTGDTPYDRNTGFEVTAKKTTKARMTAFVVTYIVLSTLVSSAGSWSNIDSAFYQIEPTITSGDKENPYEFLNLVATEIKAEQNLPIQLDEATTWVDIYAKENSLVYEYELAYSYEDLDIPFTREIFIEDVYPSQVEVYCSDGSKVYRDFETNWLYRYFSSDGRFVDENLISPNDCN